MTSEDERTSDSSNEELDIFLSTHLDNILDLFYELQDRFQYLFGCLRSTYITDLIMISCGVISIENSDLRTLRNCPNTRRQRNFMMEYESDLHASHFVVCMYMRDMKLRSIVSFDTWCKFCFLYGSHSTR